MSTQPTISVDEFRSITGFASNELSDSSIQDAIYRLELIADIYISKLKNEVQEVDAVPSSTKGSCTNVSSSHNEG